MENRRIRLENGTSDGILGIAITFSENEVYKMVSNLTEEDINILFSGCIDDLLDDMSVGEVAECLLRAGPYFKRRTDRTPEEDLLLIKRQWLADEIRWGLEQDDYMEDRVIDCHGFTLEVVE